MKNDSTSTPGILIPVNLVTKPITDPNQSPATEAIGNHYYDEHESDNDEDDAIVVEAITDATTVLSSPDWLSGKIKHPPILKDSM